jgi:hypothetical protein
MHTEPASLIKTQLLLQANDFLSIANAFATSPTFQLVYHSFTLPAAASATAAAAAAAAVSFAA